MVKTLGIKLVTSVVGDDFMYAAGQEIQDCPEERALDLLQAGHAVPLNAEKRETAKAKQPAKEDR